MGKAANVLLVAGGSGGHLFPALSVAHALRRRHPALRVGLVTTRHPRDQRALASMPQLLHDPAMQLCCVPHSSTSWWSRLRALPALWHTAHRLLAEWQPRVVLGFGGWVSAPLLGAALLRRIPVLLHEQNVQPGRANRWLGRCADGVAVSFAATRDTWPTVAGKLCVTGNPIRFGEEEVTCAMARQHWGLNGARLTVLAMGGSGGAQAINEALPQACAGLTPTRRAHLHVIHLAGAREAAVVERRYQAIGVAAHIVPFLDQMAWAYRAADVVVSRAGASTIAELAHFGCPAVFIPYPYARRHQHANAAHVASRGGAMVLEQTPTLTDQLTQTLTRFVDAPEHLRAMRAHMAHLDIAGAAERVTEWLCSTLERTGRP